jgi:hypothetical protein
MNVSPLRLARLSEGLSQAAPAKRLGIDRTTLSRVETGFVERGPTYGNGLPGFWRCPKRTSSTSTGRVAGDGMDEGRYLGIERASKIIQEVLL